MLLVRIVETAGCLAVMAVFVKLGIVNWLINARDHPYCYGTPKSNVEAVLFMAIPSGVLLGGGMFYWLTFGWSRPFYLGCGAVWYAVFIPVRRVVGLWIGRRAYAARFGGVYGGLTREVWAYFREVWRPTRPYARDSYFTINIRVFTPICYLVLWPVAVALCTYHHVERCQDLTRYRLPEWRQYTTP